MHALALRHGPCRCQFYANLQEGGVAGIQLVLRQLFRPTGRGSGAWIIGLIAIPTFVFRTIKMPPDEHQKIMADYDMQLAPVQRHLQANRSILESLPT